MTTSVPFGYIADGQLFLAMIKATLEHGWYLSNGDLGAPLGSNWHDYPVASGDSLHLLILHALSVFSDNYVVVLHMFYLLGYALTAISAFAVLRLLDVSRGPAIVCATLFTLLPYHLALQEAHPFHTAYWVIPIACFLVLALLLDRQLFRRREGSPRGPLAFASRTTLATLGACVLVGSAGANYYSVFTAGLVLIAGLVAAVRFDWRRSLATAGVVAAAILAVLALNALPSIIYDAQHGATDEALVRSPQESELYSLSLFDLLAPSPGHRIGPLDELRQDYVETSPTPIVARAPGLGLVAALGFLWLIGFAIASLITGRPWVDRWRIHGAASAAALIAFLIGTTGGLGLFFAHLVTPEIRVWNRLQLFIAFFALVAVGALLDLAIRRLGPSGRGRVAATALLAVVLVVGFFDQSNSTYIPPYDQMRAEFESDGAFVDSIEDELGPDAAVFQLPYAPFPEWWPSSGMNAFDSFRGYLHSDDLRWSYAAAAGRPENWQPGVIDESVAQVLPRVWAAGFAGVFIDRHGYPDNAQQLEAAIREEVGEPPLVAPDGRFSFFDLREYGDALGLTSAEIDELKSATLSPLLTQAGLGLVRFQPPNGNYSPNFRMDGTTAQLGLVNPSGGEREATLELSLAPDAAADVEVTFPDGSSGVVKPGRTLRETLSLAPGTVIVQLQSKSDAAPGFIGARLYDSDLEALGERAAGVGVQP